MRELECCRRFRDHSPATGRDGGCKSILRTSWLPLTAVLVRLPGLPLTQQTSVAVLLEHNVTVGIGTTSSSDARNLPYDIAWVRGHTYGMASSLNMCTCQVAYDTGGKLSKEDTIALASTNVELLLGGDVEPAGIHDMIVTEGGDILEMQSKVVAVISPGREIVDLL